VRTRQFGTGANEEADRVAVDAAGNVGLYGRLRRRFPELQDLMGRPPHEEAAVAAHAAGGHLLPQGAASEREKAATRGPPTTGNVSPCCFERADEPVEHLDARPVGAWNVRVSIVSRYTFTYRPRFGTDRLRSW